MTLILDITDNNGKQIVHQQYNNDSEFYLGAIDKDGQYKSLGKLPSRKILINSIRKSAQQWAQEEDLQGFFQELRLMLIKEYIKKGEVQAQNFIEEDTSYFYAGELADQIRSSLMQSKKELSGKFVEEYGKEGGVFLFHFAYEMMLAMLSRLREDGSRVQTVWEFPLSAFDKNKAESILEWLFRR